MAEVCKDCGDPLIGGRKGRKFCHKDCAANYQKKQWRLLNPKSPLGQLATGTVAEVNEMRVAIDLLSRGYEVYRAAFQGMPCDLLICGKNTWVYPGNEPQRVEVTTGTFTSKGTLAHPTRDETKYDVLAVVATEANGDTKIVYKPEL